MDWNTETLTLVHHTRPEDIVVLVKWVKYSDGWYGYTKAARHAAPWSVMSAAWFYSESQYSPKG
jgi:hypothetical protein